MPAPLQTLISSLVLLLCVGCGAPSGTSSASDSINQDSPKDDSASPANDTIQIPPPLRLSEDVSDAFDAAPEVLQNTFAQMTLMMIGEKGVHPLLVERAKQIQTSRSKPDIRPEKTLFQINRELNAMAMAYLWTSHQIRLKKSQENPFAQDKMGLDSASLTFSRDLELARKHWVGKSAKVTVRVAALDGDTKQVQVAMLRSDEDLQGGLYDPVGDISKRFTFAIIGRPRYQAFSKSAIDPYSTAGAGWLHVPEDYPQADAAQLKVGQELSLSCRILDICVMDRIPNHAFNLRPTQVSSYDGIRYFDPQALTQRLIAGEIDSVANYYNTMLNMDRILVVAQWDKRPGINLQANVRPDAATAEISPAYLGRIRQSADAVRAYFSDIGLKNAVPVTPEREATNRNEDRELFLKELASGNTELLKTPWPVDGFGSGAVGGFNRWRLSQYAAVPKIDLLGQVYGVSQRSRDLPAPPKTALPDELLNAEWFKQQIHTGRLDPAIMGTYPYDQRGWNPLHYAIYNSHNEIAKELLLDPYRVAPFGRILHDNRWDSPTEKTLLRNLGDPAGEDDHFETLSRAMNTGLEDIAPESPYATPLHLAAIVDNAEMAKVLIEEASRKPIAVRPLIAHAWLKLQNPFGAKYVDYSVLRTRHFNEVETVYQDDDHLLEALMRHHHRRISTKSAFPKLYPRDDFENDSGFKLVDQASGGTLGREMAKGKLPPPSHFGMSTWEFATKNATLLPDESAFSARGRLHFATINEPDAYGFTPLDYARLFGSERVERLLVQAKAYGNVSVKVLTTIRRP